MDDRPDKQAQGGQSRPRRRRARRLAVWLVVPLLLVALLAGLALWQLPGRSVAAPAWLRDRVEARLDAALPGLALRFDSMVVAVGDSWRPRVRLREVRVLRREAPDRSVLSLSDLEVALSLRALLRGRIKPRHVRVAGVFATLIRDADGRFDLSLVQHGDGDLPPVADPAEAVALLHDALLSEPLETLRSVGVRALTLRYEDRRSGLGWTVDGGRLRLRRNGRSVQIGGDFALLSGRDYAATIEATLDSRIGEAGAEFGLNFKDMAAADIAVQSPALAWLAGLRAPISGALRGGYGGPDRPDGQGGLAPLSATLQIGAGVLQPTEATRPIPFDAARAYVTYTPGTGRVQFDELSVQSDWVSARVEGSAVLDYAGADAGWPSALLGQFTLRDIRANPGGLYPSPIELARADMDLRLRLDPFRVDLGQLGFALRGRWLQARGRAAAGPDGWDVALDADLDSADPELVLDHWPPVWKSRTREWIADNILEAQALGAHFALRSRAPEKPRLHLGFEFSDATVLFMKTMPPIEGGSGRFVIEDNRMVIAAETGHVVAPQGGRIGIAGSVFEVPDIRIKGAPARITVASESTVTAALALLDNEPFRFLSKAGQPVTLADGRARAETVLRLPLKQGLEPGDVRFDVAGVATGLRSETVVPGRVISAQQLALRADNDALTVSGAGRLGRVPFDGSWNLPIGPGQSGASRVEADIELSERFIDEFGIGLPAGAVNGAAEARVEIDLPPRGPADFVLRSDLRGLGLRIDALGWGMARATRGALDVAGRLGSPPSIDRLSLEAPGLSAQGRLSLSGTGSLTRAEFSRVRAGQWLDAPVVLTGRGAGATPGVTIRRGAIDLRHLPDLGGGAVSGRNAGGPVDLALDRLQITEGIALTGFAGRFDTRGGGLSGDFSARVNGAAPVTGRVSPQNDGSAVELLSDNAGAALRAAGLLEQARGGALKLSLVPTGKEGHYDGKLVVTNTRLRDAPAMAELLNAISIVGLLEQLGGPGINFAEVEALFRLTPTQVILRRSSAIGPSMGISLDGYYDLASGRMDMQGVASPIYLFNSIGSVLTRKGEGLFGFNFTLRGTKDRPRVGVNPLSALTPGTFREIFRRPPPRVSGQGGAIAPEKPPERPRLEDRPER